VLDYNPTFEELHRPTLGPLAPYAKKGGAVQRNVWNGHAEHVNVGEFNFEDQRVTFEQMGYAVDPSVDNSSYVSVQKYIGDKKTARSTGGETLATRKGLRVGDKRKREDKGAASNVTDYGLEEGFKGPWAKYKDEITVAKPSEEEIEEMAKWAEQDQGSALVANTKKVKAKKEAERSVLHIKETHDYQGRTYMHAPQDIGKMGQAPAKCFIPKKEIHTWTGHTKGVSKTQFLPNTAHLMLSCGLDSKIKLWEVYGQRRCLRTFHGHSQAVRDITFNNDGTKFLSAGYDRMVRLWDTETGQMIRKFTNKKIPYCVKFNPNEDKQHLFVAGTQDKKILCYDINSGETVQEYDRHLGAVNTINFVEDGRRMVSSSDDKSIRVWEWDIPVDTKYIADPKMHSMPAACVHPMGKYMLFQSMDNQIVTFGARDRFRQNKKKTFKGHMTAGYACGLSVSPDGHYVVSGDGNGFLVVWDWKTCKRFAKIKAHDDVCIGADWHPYETSKVVTCGWDGLIKLWD